MIGKTIGEYRIIEKRGEGGMGMFYKAVDLRLDRQVGLKTLRAELTAQPELLEKLQAEAKTLAHLDHPNIARLLHYIVAEDQHFIVMEYVEGLDLSEKTRAEGLLPLSLLADLNSQICRAIDYAHGKNVIHRDIKPSNILVTAANVVKVTDFGIAKILGVSARTRTGVATGSLPFMAPEQIRGEPVDARTDIYQLGVTIFELATGQRPFTAETEYEMMTRHLEEAPPRPSTINPRVTPQLDAVILKALAKKPEDRFASAAAFGEALRAAILEPSQHDEVETRVDAPLPPPHPAPPAQPTHRAATPADRPPAWAPPAREAPPPTPVEPARDAVFPPPVSETKRRTTPWLVVGGLAIVALVALWWFGLRKAPSPPPEPATVTLTAQVPTEVDIDRIAVVLLTTSHPDAGVSADTIRATDGSIRHELTVAPAPWVSFTLEGYDPENGLLFEGRAEREIPETGDISLHVPLYATAPAEREQPVDHPPRDTSTAVPTQVETPVKTPSEATAHNLTVDILPFSARTTVEHVWLDGSEQDGSLPIQARLSPGRHAVRWQIGPHRWTDTVTVGPSGSVEKHLFAEAGLGRLNISARFSGAAGYADIWIDGTSSGNGTPYELRDVATGPHEITLVREGFRMRGGPRIVNVVAGERTRVEVEMIPE